MCRHIAPDWVPHELVSAKEAKQSSIPDNVLRGQRCGKELWVKVSILLTPSSPCLVRCTHASRLL